MWLALTILLCLALAPPIATIAKKPADASTPTALIATAVMAYGVVASLLIVPRFVLPRLQATRSENEIAFIRWGFAIFPMSIGMAAVSAGAQPWAFVVGQVVSIGLCIQVARSLVSEARSANR